MKQWSMETALAVPTRDIDAALVALDAEEAEHLADLVRLRTVRNLLVARLAAPNSNGRLPPEWLTVDDVVVRLKKSPTTVWRLLRRRGFPGARKMGGEWRIPEKDVRAYEASCAST